MTDDVVAELDAWLGAWEGPDDYRLTVQRARDEIMTLRAMREAHIRMLAANCDDARDEALEEAAQLAHANGFGETAAAIRALKEKH